MNPLFFLVFEVIYRPIFNLLMTFVSVFDGNMGFAIIVLTLLVRFALRKTSMAGNQMQEQMGELGPKMEAIQTKYKDDPVKLQEETMKLLKKQGAGPLKGCMMMLAQIPVFLGLYAVVMKFANPEITFRLLPPLTPIDDLYSFVYPIALNYTDLVNVETIFFGMDLLTKNNLVLAIIVGILMYTQMRFTSMIRKPQSTPAVPGASMPDMSKMMGVMNVFLALMLALFVYSTQAGVGLYILTTTVFSISQFVIQYKSVIKAKRSALTSK